jgi:NTE family protein
MPIFEQITRKVGLALGSGVARGLAHIGVLKVLEEARIPIDMIAGTSIGALVGACYARDGKISRAEEAALKVGWKEFARLLYPNLVSMRKGLIHSKRVEEMLHYLIGNAQFSDLLLPLATVATDIHTGEEIVSKTGSVIDAVRASISIPAVFVPVKLDGRCLVDGGVTNPVPSDVVRAMGADIVIAVNVLTDPRRQTANPMPKHDPVEPPNLLNTLIQSMYIMEHEITKLKIPIADVTIVPSVGHLEAHEFFRAKEAIEAGISATLDKSPQIQNLIVNQ